MSNTSLLSSEITINCPQGARAILRRYSDGETRMFVFNDKNERVHAAIQEWSGGRFQILAVRLR